MKIVAVLGGLGYIGSHLVKLLLNNKYQVKILDNQLFGRKHLKKLLDHKSCSFLKGDIRNSYSLAKIMKGTNYVVHLAGLVGDPACSVSEDTTWLNNTLSTKLVVDVANYYNVEKLVFASSCSVYGASPADYFLNEGSCLNPVSLYAKTKIDSERILFERFNNSCTVLRLSTVFGYSSRMRFDLVANLFTIKAIKNREIEVFGGTQYRPFIHCLDAARAFFTVVEFEDSEKINKEVFNISVESLTIKDLGHVVASLIPGTEIKTVDVKEDNRNYRVSSEKSEWILDFKPTIKISDGIIDMYEKLQNGFDDWKTNSIYYNYFPGC